MQSGKGESLSIYGMDQGTQLWPQVLSKIPLELRIPPPIRTICWVFSDEALWL